MQYRLLLLLLVFSLPLQNLAAQKGKEKKGGEEDSQWLEDPYSTRDGKNLSGVDYMARGRFHWADNHSTKDIDKALGGTRIRWLETAHFRIGSSLEEYTIDTGSRTEKAKLKQELAELKKRLPKVPRKTRKLDPWLRLHLFAMRAENLYVEIETLLQVTDQDFPTGPGQKKMETYMGEGPYLGMKNKFTLLFFDKESSLGRYRSAFMERKGDKPIRFMFPLDGTLLFGMAAESEGLFSDTTMHCLFAYSLSMNLLNGYRYYRHALPEWVSVGMGHWFARRIDPTRNYFTQDRIFGSDDKNIWKWGPKVRARVSYDYFPRFEEIMDFPDSENMKYTDHMLAWSRVDFLMNQKPEGFAIWFKLLKEPYPDGVTQTAESLKERQRKALLEAWHLTPASFDADWAAWCLKHYPKK